MPRINLQFGVEGTADVTRAVLGLSAAMKRVFAEMKTEAAKAAAATVAGQRQTVVAERAALEQRKALIHSAYDDWKKSERALTDAVSKGSHDRDRIAKTEASTRMKYLDSLKVSAGQVEREWTRIMEEEARKRDAIRDREASASRGGGRGGGGSGGGLGTALRSTLGSAMGVAQDLHGQMQDARRTRAGTAQTLIGAFTQVGASRTDVQSIMGSLTATAARHGMTSDDLAGALAAAQTEFSVLGNRGDYAGMTPAQRQAALQARVQENLQTAVTGRNLGADPSEFLRLSGMFRQNRIGGVDDLLARTVAMAQQGAIEPGAITRTAMTPILRRMQEAMTAAGPNATNEQRQEAARGAYVQSFAELQVLRSRGYNPRMGGQAMANMNAALEGNTVAERMRHNLQNAMGSAQGPMRERLAALLGTGDQGLFEADPTMRGRMRLRSDFRGNALNLSGRLAEVGLDPTQAGNILAGGGRGNPQSLQRNWNQLVQAMMATNGEGVAGFQAVKQLSTANLSETERASMADVFENSPMAELNRNEERRLGALTDNSSRLVDLSNRFAAFTAANPMGSTVAAQFGSVAGTVLGTVLSRIVGGGGGAGALANGGGSILNTVLQGGGAGLGVGAGGLAAMGLIGGGALAAGAYMDRQHYLGQYGLSGNDVDWMGRPTIQGGQESITNLIRENDRNRHNRQLANADDFDAAHGSDAAAQRFMGTDEGRALARRTWGGTTVFSGHREVGADGVAHTVATGSQYVEAGPASDRARRESANTPGTNEANTFLAGAIGDHFRRVLSSTVIRVSMDPQDTSHAALNAASDGGSPGAPPPTSPARHLGGTGNSYMDGLGGG